MQMHLHVFIEKHNTMFQGAGVAQLVSARPSELDEFDPR